MTRKVKILTGSTSSLIATEKKAPHGAALAIREKIADISLR